MKTKWFVPLLCLTFLSHIALGSKIIRFPNNLFPTTNSFGFLDNNLSGPFSSKRVSSPPKEYFSINTVYLRNQFIVHMGKDLINGNYVVMPSPNIMSVEPRANGKKLIKLQQYFPDLEKKLMEIFGLTPTQIHYLYITSYKVIDQHGKEVQSIYIPENVHYRPPMTMSFEIDGDVKVLSFIFSFTSRTAWADSGIGSDLTSIYRDIRSMDIDRDAKMFLKLDPENSSEIYEVYNSDESQKINQILSELHQIIIWGDMPNREKVLEELLDLKTFQFVSIDLKNLSSELAKYPHLFGNPVDPKWISKFNKLRAYKFRDEEITNEKSGKLSLGLDGIFSFGGSSSKKTHKRLKEIFTFEMEGDFYIPKAINFSLRADNSLTMLKTLTFQAYQNLEEKQYYLGVGVEVEPPAPGTLKIVAEEQTAWVNKYHQSVNFTCPNGKFLTGASSRHSNGHEDRIFKYTCSDISLFKEKVRPVACEKSRVINGPDKPVVFSCPDKKVLVGENSKFHKGPKDRVYSYNCCALEHPFAKVTVDQCSLTPFINGWDAYFDFKCPQNMVLKGTHSYHNNKREDRRFRFECCAVRQVKE